MYSPVSNLKTYLTVFRACRIFFLFLWHFFFICSPLPLIKNSTFHCHKKENEGLTLNPVLRQETLFVSFTQTEQSTLGKWSVKVLKLSPHGAGCFLSLTGSITQLLSQHLTWDLMCQPACTRASRLPFGRGVRRKGWTWDTFVDFDMCWGAECSPADGAWGGCVFSVDKLLEQFKSPSLVCLLMNCCLCVSFD